MAPRAETDDSASFLKALKRGVRDVIGNKDSHPRRARGRDQCRGEDCHGSSQDFRGR